MTLVWRDEPVPLATYEAVGIGHEGWEWVWTGGSGDAPC